MPTRRTIAIVTGTRAEFGLLLPVMRAILAERTLKLQTIVTGVHLVQSTWRDVPAAGFTINARVPMQRRDQTGRTADVAALGRGVAGLGAAFARLKPDVVLVLGDRVEALAAACAASVGGFRLAHIHGGDRAEGVADEAMRHAISKLAHLHFAASRLSRRRLVRMGEAPEFVFETGSPAIDGLHEVEAMDDVGVLQLGLDPTRPYVVVMQHPVGADVALEKRWMLATLSGVGAATRRGGVQKIVLAPNADPGRDGILNAISAAHAIPITHLPRTLFLALLKRAAALVGNSSAGLIEAAALRRGGVPAVNIGPRQAGREQAGNVIDCEYGKDQVAKAMRLALAHRARALRHPYGDGQAGKRIAHLLASIKLPGTRKRNGY